MTVDVLTIGLLCLLRVKQITNRQTTVLKNSFLKRLLFYCFKTKRNRFFKSFVLKQHNHITTFIGCSKHPAATTLNSTPFTQDTYAISSPVILLL